MFGFFKKKKKEKIEAPAAEEEKEEKVEDESILKDLAAQKGQTLDTGENSNLSPKEQAKKNRINSLRARIAQMLQSNNVEIIDENEGDEYEVVGGGGSSGDTAKQQQDYDSLKAQYGSSGKKKKEELTLTIDDFDYTYVGKYVEEYDIIHLKSIKKIKLPNPHAKLIKRLSFACVGVIVVVIASFIAYSILRVKPEYLESVSLSQENQSYYKGEYFDFTGINIVAKYSTGRVEYSALTMENYVNALGGAVSNTSKGLLFENGTSTTLYFKFKGFVGENSTAKTDLELFITINEKEKDGLCVMYSDGIFDLKAGDAITSKYLIPLVEHKNYDRIKLDLSSVSISIDEGNPLSFDSSEDGFILTSDLTSTSKIYVSYNVKITNTLTKSVTIELQRDSNMISKKVDTSEQS